MITREQLVNECVDKIYNLYKNFHDIKSIIYYENNVNMKRFDNFILFLDSNNDINNDVKNILKNIVTNRAYYINPKIHEEFKIIIKQTLSNIDESILYEILNIT
jgi:hypothetical protein